MLIRAGYTQANPKYKPEVSVGYTLLNRPEAEVRFPLNRYRNLFIHAGFSYRFRIGVGGAVPNPDKDWRYAPALFVDLINYKGFGVHTGISYSSWSRRFTYSFLTGYSALRGYIRYEPGMQMTTHYQSRINANVYHFMFRATLFVGPRRITGFYAEGGAAVNSGNRNYSSQTGPGSSYETYLPYRQVGGLFGLGVQFKVYGFLNPE
ncbi:MAG: hypothetical protein ACT6QS_06570 [Flavobacteriales bacterium]